ncbi:MAG: hypothetical protein MJ098_05255 [Saccharofermentans sp.]|nr:hypothetical protein [Saccharofermentans sp.]
MKNITKLLTVLIIAALTFSIAGCGNIGKIDIEELQKNTGVMLVISRHPQMAMTQEEYERSRYDITVFYDGTITLPGNPIDHESPKLTDKDYVELYKFCTKNAEKSKYANYKEDVCDGETYTFAYYDLDGKAHIIYSGYCYANKDLQRIREITANYYCD